MTQHTTLITGASSGIGYHLAREFAKHGHSLVLVAPLQKELDQVAGDMSALYDVNVLPIAGDLEDPETPQRIFDLLAKKNLRIETLVNNAGHGFRGKSWDIPVEQDLSMVRLNIEAILRMTKLFLPPMIARGSGRLLTTASVAGFEPGPLLNVYHATKAFILSWSEALAMELEDTPLTVTALCPGPTDTDFFLKADMMATRAFQKAGVMAPQDVARAGYEGLVRGELFVVPGVMNKTLVAARRVLSEGAQAKINQKFYEEVPKEEQTRKRGEFERAAAVK